MTRYRIAWFVTPHGFGHATRSAAVAAALRRQSPNTDICFFTQVPDFIFRSVLDDFEYQPLICDLGLVQKSALEVDIPASLDKLNRFYPIQESFLATIADQLRDFDLVVCDIAPLGLAAGRKAGLATVLIENFTWDWIYEGIDDPRFADIIRILKPFAQSGDLHIQTRPICLPQPGAQVVNPVSRAVHEDRGSFRKTVPNLGHRPLVLITMGGIQQEFAFLDQLRLHQDLFFICPGGDGRQETNIWFPATDAQLYHPDLINAADLVVAKLGYSTVAEVYAADVPLAFIPRPGFRESEALAAFIGSKVPHLVIQEEEFQSGTWLKNISALINPTRKRQWRENGADQAATRILSFLATQKRT